MIENDKNVNTHCGYIGIIGRPNVGKSTLLNSLLETKLVITSKKAQTTRHNILGIKTKTDCQYIYIDTPGYRQVTDKALHRYLNRTASQTIFEADVIVWVVDATRWTKDDDAVLTLLKRAECPIVLALNKVDLVTPKQALLPLIEKYKTYYPFASIVPLTALKKIGVNDLEDELRKQLPQLPFAYDEDQLTNRDERFVISEIIREKIMRFLGKEVPYSVAVEIEQLKHEEKICHIHALLWVERDGQKAIVIGDKGENLKRIGQQARLNIETFIEKKVMLKLWVKVKSNWADSDKYLKQFGYDG